MTNNLVLPLLALLLAVLAALFPFKKEGRDSLSDRLPEIRVGSIIGAIVLILFLGSTFVWPNTLANGAALTLAMAIGMIVTVASSLVGPGQGGLAIGMAVFGASLLHLDFMRDSLSTSSVAFLSGSFVSAFATGGLRTKIAGGYLTLVVALLVVAADFLGSTSTPVISANAPFAGTSMGIALLVGCMLSGLTGRGSSSRIVQGGVGFAVIAVLGYLACWKFLNTADLGNLWVGGVIVGGVVHLLLTGETEPEPFRFILSSVIWLAAATVAFAYGHGLGMGIAMLGGAGTLILFGNMRGLTSMAVVVSILLYRVFREIFPDEAKALDIGQHYTMIGIALGSLLPLLPIEWARGRHFRGAASYLATAIWLILLLGIPVASAILLGSKGAIGMIVGMSFAAVVEGLRGTVSLAPMGIAGGLGALTILNYKWLGDWTDLERAAKVKAVVIVSVIALILAAALFGISRTNQETESK